MFGARKVWLPWNHVSHKQTKQFSVFSPPLASSQKLDWNQYSIYSQWPTFTALTWRGVSSIQPIVLEVILRNSLSPQHAGALIDVTNACVQDGFCCLRPILKQLCLCLCYRCDGPAEDAAFGLRGLRGPYASRQTQQQAGQPGTHLQALFP